MWVRFCEDWVVELLRKNVQIIQCGCWLMKRVKHDGYGQFRVNGRKRRAHRVMYEVFIGPIPEGEVLDHLCRVKRCVNPGHLEAVSRRESTRRGDRFAMGHWGGKRPIGPKTALDKLISASLAQMDRAQDS